MDEGEVDEITLIRRITERLAMGSQIAEVSILVNLHQLLTSGSIKGISDAADFILKTLNEDAEILDRDPRHYVMEYLANLPSNG